ncbi:MAG: FKBP-type peptidyl-prolyl cis-trans isomerase [Gammaproteobacteria bacterium]|nr:FKBP-type peptidyl-prolyl cis-trans isomerase [Gammaproteobacteria bacterium]
MFKHIPAALGCLGLLLSTTAQADDSLKTDKDKVSYSIGINWGAQLSQAKGKIDIEKVSQGMKDGFNGKQPKLTMEEMKQVITNFQQAMQKEQQDQMEKMGETNKKAGEAFLAENKKKEGVKTLPSGLQYIVLKAGTGKSPKVTDTVVTHYQGNLIDGKVFDSSYKRGQPATFPVNGVIKGWTEALQKMKVGGKWKLFIPSELAYGKNAPPAIGPNSVLIFEIELLEIKKS